MVSDRPYRTAMPHAQAVEELRTHSRLQFDPELVDLFIRLFADSPPRPDQSLMIAPPVSMGSAVLSRRRASA
jgi:HD-GYP domain-containing protein (c-di-GMP phosphodiesterase class II)